MTTTSTDTKCKKYVPIADGWETDGKTSLKDCCFKDPKDDPKGCDCCYDNWNDELKNKRDEFGRKSEAANQAKDKLAFSKGRRDGFKKWRDDLTTLDEQSREICDQFSLIISQVSKICSASGCTVKAVEILFCMLRDFYAQLDKIKKKYEDLQTCIKKLDKSILVPGQGFMKCLETYYGKLDILITTREDIIKQIMDIIKMANLVHEDVCTPFGLSCILEEWQCRLNCEGKGVETPEPCKDVAADNKDMACPGDDKYLSCDIIPQITFPIAAHGYTAWVNCRYDKAVVQVTADSDEYLNASKEKEAIAASIASLTDAVAITNPKDRCK